MRLLYTFNNEKHAAAFHFLLSSKKIENELEIHSDTDWGSSSYGERKCLIWVYDEEQFEEAESWLQHFLLDPDNPKYYQHRGKEPPAIEKELPGRPPRGVSKARMTGVITLYLILLCTMLFLIGLTPMRSYRVPPNGVPLTPLYSTPIKKTLMFDYPKAYQIIDEFIGKYGIDKLYTPEELPPQGKMLLTQFIKTPYWQGFYDKFVSFFKGKPIQIHAPLFEKIRQGEVWRLFTPALLHNDLFHLFFNMIWLLVLGKQMEHRLGILKYLLFILITGIFSNVCQYLVSGSNFIGFSGVLVGMIAFVWIRQKRAPWEGYQLLPVTMGFITIFIFAMAGLQLISFVLEIYGKAPISPPIANTAHLAGGLCGYILARTPLFRWNP